MHDHIDHTHHVMSMVTQVVLVLPFLIALLLYLIGVFLSNKKWSKFRTASWVIGILCVASAVAGPLAERAHVDFTAHMIGHLLLGMLGPLLMVLAAPMTLLYRTIPVAAARRLTKLLKSRPIRVVTDPIVASLLNVGGLWILYTTTLYTAMHESAFLHVLVHFHVFLAGYLFTISMIYIDPSPHRRSYLYRSVVLILALAAHGILSKYIYATPPVGVSQAQAESGAILMYYGGDVVDVIIIFLLCLQWYRDSRPRISIGDVTSNVFFHRQ